MFIGKEDRLSRAEARRKPSWDADRKPPRNWRKAVLVLLYALLGLLGGLAVLSGVALFLQSGRPPAPPPAPVPTPLAEVAPPPVPAAPPAPPAPPAAAAPDSAALQALQQQVHDANAALAGLRTETERLRKGLADAAAQRQAPPDPQQTEAAWADAERTVRALTQRPAAAAPAAPIATPRLAPPPPAAEVPQTNLAANQPVAPPTQAPLHRPRVFLHYQSGSAAALQVATDIAQRLLFSDFTYADTRSAADAPTRPVIRYFFPEDAPAAQRLADLLGGAGTLFRVQDASDHPGRATAGTLDVWIGR